MRRRKRKLYNPFKMWGSWIGAFLYPIGLILIIIFTEGGTVQQEEALRIPLMMTYSIFAKPFLFLLQPIVDKACIGALFFCPFAIIGILAYVLSGFFLGWGINSLYRKFKK